MQKHLLIGGLVTIFLILISGFFSFAETALTTCNKNKMLSNKSRRAKYVISLISRKSHMIGTILFANTLVNVFLSSIATSCTIEIFGEKYIIVASLVITAIILIFAEVLPKTIAILNPDKFSLMIAPLVLLSFKAFYPAVFIIHNIVNFLLVIMRLKKQVEKSSFTQDIKDLVYAHKCNVNFDMNQEDEKAMDMVGSISILKDMTVANVMIHRLNVNIIDINDDIDKITNVIINSTHSRIPICKGDADNIIGILNIKDALKEFLHSASDAQCGSISKEDLIRICQKPLFIPEYTSLLRQLDNFHKDHKHFGIIIDEYSVFLGIVTTTDIVEEIVGNMYDEYNHAIEFIKTIEKYKHYELNGVTPMHTFVNELGLERVIDNYCDYTTISGFIIDKLGRIPNQDDVLTFKNCIFTMIKVSNNKIELIDLKFNMEDLNDD